MTQATTYSVPLVGPATPTVMAQRIDDNFDAIISSHSGSARPAYAVAGMIWEDTSVANETRLWFYDGAQDILVAVVDTANDRVELAPQPLVDIASAATTDIGAVKSRNIRVTGTTTITSFGTVRAGTTRTVYFAAALSVTYNATSLITPTGGSLAVAAGDSVDLVSLGAGNWRVLRYVMTSPIKRSSTVTLSGSAVDFAIPAGVQRISFSLADVSTNGTAVINLQLGTAASVENSGYVGSVGEGTGLLFSTAFSLMRANIATAVYYGQGEIKLHEIASNKWVSNGLLGRSDSGQPAQGWGGSKPLSAALTRIRFTTANGTDTFDAGTITVFWEF
jgi:hypothetical protein